MSSKQSLDTSEKSTNLTKIYLSILMPLLLIAVTFTVPASNLASAATTYSVTISTVLDSNTVNGVSVPIAKDGIQTGYYTPHTFTGLSGNHNFTVPYADSSNHPFSSWDSTTPTDSFFNTITVSSGDSFWAYYDSHLPREGVSPAQQRYYVTPSDASVLAIASNKSWSDIINWVSSSIDYDVNCNIWQFPNETIALRTGQCREFSTLAVSILLARGYSAYVTTGNSTDSRGTDGHAWIVIKLNNVWYHFEPQYSCANQPSPQEFLGYNPEYCVNDKELLASIISYDPPLSQTYDVTINTVLDSLLNGNQIAIFKDGLPTGFISPHTFVGLSGTHNFTIPILDGNNHWFRTWSANTPDNIFTTITVSLGGTFTAYYTMQFNISTIYPAEFKFLVTPHDTAVVSAASTKSLSDILNYVSALSVGSGTVPQFPNQTLTKGTIHFFLDRASLCCSMLCARGYTAYLVRGNSIGPDSWVVVNINGIAYHIDPKYPWNSQQSIDFSSYQASYYVDENGIYPPAISLNPPSNLPSVTPTPTPFPSPTPSPTPTPTPTTSPTATPTVTPTPTPSPTATPTPTTTPTASPTTPWTTNPTIAPTTTPTAKPTPDPTATSTPQPTPTPTIPELTPVVVVITLFVAFITTMIMRLHTSKEK